jgi:hypothetical protein
VDAWIDVTFLFRGIAERVDKIHTRGSGFPTMSLISAFRPPSTRQDALRSPSILRRRHRPTTYRAEHAEDELDADHAPITPSKHTPKVVRAIKGTVAAGGPLRPFRLLRQDWNNLKKRYVSDWTAFNQLVFASAVYLFFTNILPGITFASDLFVLTGKNWGTIEVVFSTGLCGIIFSLLVSPHGRDPEP